MSSVLNIIKGSASNKKVLGIPNFKLNAPLKTSPYSEPLGIEIELEGRNLPTAGYLDGLRSTSGSAWDVHQDGSLRNGLEYTLSKPCREEEVDYMIRGLFNVFEQRDTRLIPSNRCSLHVHYNIGGLKINAITSIVALWTIFEEPLLRWWGDARLKNHFCLSSKDEGANVAGWETFLTTGRFPEDNGLRYTALNLMAIRKYGSIEFRGGGAVSEPDKAIVWVRFLYNLCEYAKAKYPNPQQIAYDLSERGAKAILEDMCTGEFEAFCSEILETVEEFDRCCAESFYNFQPIIFGFPWAQWLGEIEKVYVPDPFQKKTIKVRAPRFETFGGERDIPMRFNANTGMLEEVN